LRRKVLECPVPAFGGGRAAFFKDLERLLMDGRLLDPYKQAPGTVQSVGAIPLPRWVTMSPTISTGDDNHLLKPAEESDIICGNWGDRELFTAFEDLEVLSC